MLSRRILQFAAAAMLLTLGVWAATSIGFSSDEPSGNRHQLTAIGKGKDPPPSLIDYSRLDRRLQSLMEENSMIGLGVAIVENGEIRFLKGYGETVAGSGQPVTPNTVFRWASLSKGVAADMIALLAAQDRLSLYEPVAKYSATLRLPGGNEHKATISDLLSHRLGLFSHANDSKLEDDMDPRMLRMSLAELNAICPPGTCHSYQNVAYDAASEIVEKVTGERYEDAVRRRLFRPLGMTSASISRDGLVTAPSWARPHVGGKNSKPVEVVESYYRVPAAGGVNSSIKDLALWMKAQMGENSSVLPAQALQAVQSARATTPGEMGRMRKFRERIAKASYGLGWRIYDYAGHRVIGHRGGVRGYRSLVMFDPERKSGVVALWNSSTNQPGGLEFEVMDMLYRLPQRDWLGVDDRPTPDQPTPEEAGNVIIGGGGSR
ncbi:serine hydrolase domain-containing protein [Sphingosinicella rhizophila]|uniref:Serine hydrolase domain-containing protein n=1 Tax=Sphingosinicella rhizophila TaxID=3050082 RepID=A0ABU3Q384_9SPHN|nr:serine hydrolase domain-containing protein [Sphingosinicella sp. GR2756]MDT9597866.1 serine hydrolase domain-containing protein [Sphingosinicella sp. GR2756]